MDQAKICAVCERLWTRPPEPRGLGIWRVVCDRCGTYSIDGAALDACNPKARSFDRVRAAGWVRANQGTLLTAHTIQAFSTLKMPSASERARKILIEIAKRHPQLGRLVPADFTSSRSPEWEAISWSRDESEVSFLVTEILVSRGLLHRESNGAVMITPSGYEVLDALSTGAPSRSNIGFCAMWFDPGLTTVYLSAIEPAIRQAGYEPVRIDRVEHLNKIDDEIVAAIRQSKFVIADLTGSRGGVYFEAGLAFGLGLKVIYTVRSDSFHEIHFDTRQYNCLGWNLNDLPGFRDALQFRIEANLGRGDELWSAN